MPQHRQYSERPSGKSRTQFAHPFYRAPFSIHHNCDILQHEHCIGRSDQATEPMRLGRGR